MVEGERRAGGVYLLLGHAAVEFGGFEAEEAEDDAHAVDFAFLAEEDDDFVGVDGLAEEDQVRESLVFSSGPESDELLDQVADGLLSCVYQQPHGPIEADTDEFVDRVRHGRGEKHRLSGLGDRGQDLVQLVRKPVFQHPVRLVQHEDLQGVDGETGRVAHVVDETPGGGDDHVWS